MVLVTGHEVTVVRVMTVTVESSGPAGVAPALTPGAGVTSGAVGTVEVSVMVTVEMVCDVVTMVEAPEVIVAVTGHSVVVV